VETAGGFGNHWLPRTGPNLKGDPNPMAILTDEAEPIVEDITIMIDTLSPENQRAALVRLLAIAALNQGDIDIITTIGDEAVATVKRFLREKAAVAVHQW
jgi:hypothetical protein